MSAKLCRSVVQRLLREPRNIQRVVSAIYPEAQKDQGGKGFLVADIAGGVGCACFIPMEGNRAGHLQYLEDSNHPSRDLIDATCFVHDCAPSEALKYLGKLLRIPELKVHDAANATGAPPRPVIGDRIMAVRAPSTRRRRVASERLSRAMLSFRNT